jgi:hypothetical protein
MYYYLFYLLTLTLLFHLRSDPPRLNGGSQGGTALYYLVVPFPFRSDIHEYCLLFPELDRREGRKARIVSEMTPHMPSHYGASDGITRIQRSAMRMLSASML